MGVWNRVSPVLWPVGLFGVMEGGWSDGLVVEFTVLFEKERSIGVQFHERV